MNTTTNCSSSVLFTSIKQYCSPYGRLLSVLRQSAGILHMSAVQVQSPPPEALPDDIRFT